MLLAMGPSLRAGANAMRRIAIDYPRRTTGCTRRLIRRPGPPEAFAAALTAAVTGRRRRGTLVRGVATLRENWMDVLVAGTSRLSLRGRTAKRLRRRGGETPAESRRA